MVGMLQSIPTFASSESQTDPSVQCVQLIGSWNNFSSCYAMIRDVRRGRDQWRGCYSFEDVCDNGAGDSSSHRNGGLKMGATYYYYYEVDNSTETYDPAEPWTTSCPFLPGQTVNTLTVPVERSTRNRRASLSSLNKQSFRTMDPKAKFSTPRPPYDSMSNMMTRRLDSAPALLSNRSIPRPVPPAPSWKRLFTRKQPARDLSQSSTCHEAIEHSVLYPPLAPTHFSSTQREGSGRTRNMSPESLRQFLSEESSAQHDPIFSQSSEAFSFPDDVGEDLDDDNFASSTAPEMQQYATSLSPPPFQRSTSSDTMAKTVANSSSLTLVFARSSDKKHDAKRRLARDYAQELTLHKIDTNRQIRWSISATSSMLTSPASPQLVEDELPAIFL